MTVYVVLMHVHHPSHVQKVTVAVLETEERAEWFISKLDSQKTFEIQPTLFYKD